MVKTPTEVTADEIEVAPKQTPTIDITAQDLGYLYTVLIKSNIPAADSEFVTQLKMKIKSLLNIQ